ncbi:hypothetical protein [Dyadobacter soli]|uniref:hypothetical protein n=1 Tax=Dyadobacter soli TaxID=659014 RepID=UPI001C409D31|nr:hypothetical protein [Dyadobacter soli]
MLLVGLVNATNAFCQDTTQITFTEEYDSLPPVRFIDRYENIFMNKIPTRNIFKFGISQYQQSTPFALYNDKGFKNSAAQISYEHKLAPQFSIGVFGQVPLVGNAIPLSWIFENIAVGGQLRWYYDMKGRIESGRSANNFTGNYAAIEYTTILPSSIRQALALRTGFQRRFLNNGFLDLSIGLRKNDPFEQKNLFNNWNLFTEINLGLAVGDWKRTAKPLLCDLIRCDQQVNQHFKIQIPDLKFGKMQKALGTSVAYEILLGEMPISFNFQYDLNLQSAFNYLHGRIKTDWFGGWYAYETKSREQAHIFSIQPRFYLNQKRKLRLGKVGSDLSGIYAGINSEYAVYRGIHTRPSRWDDVIKIQLQEFTFKLNSENFRAGPLMGIQQRLFKNGYVDLNTSCNYEKQPESWKLRFRANLTVGLAFST